MRAKRPARRIGGVTQYSSYNWSGYANDNSGGNVYQKISGSWTEPALTCTNEDQIAAFWVGLDGFNGSTVEQDGTLAQCFEGTAFYYSWWEMYPTNSIQVVANVSPGDKLKSSVSFAGSKYTLTVTDSTTPSASFKETEKCGSGQTCSNASAEWIAERPSGNVGLYPLADFTKWGLSAATVTSGTTSGVISKFPEDAITMIDGTQSYTLASVSSLNVKGNAFTDTWDNSY